MTRFVEVKSTNVAGWHFLFSLKKKKEKIKKKSIFLKSKIEKHNLYIEYKQMEEILRLELDERQKKRIRKLYTEKYYLLGFDKDKQEIQISGSTNNNYRITILSNTLMCSCMDCQMSHYKGIYCKHVCFVFIKIIQSRDFDFFLKMILSNEDREKLTKILEEMTFSTNPIRPTSAFTSELSERNVGNECPICYEILDEDLSKCPDCENAVHTDCVKQWLRYHKTCVFCRSDSWKKFK